MPRSELELRGAKSPRGDLEIWAARALLLREEKEGNPKPRSPLPSQSLAGLSGEEAGLPSCGAAESDATLSMPPVPPSAGSTPCLPRPHMISSAMTAMPRAWAARYITVM